MSRPVYGIVLAAGGSLRLGQPKQLLVAEGKPLVAGIVEKLQLAGVDRVVVVLGASEDGVRSSLNGLDVDLVRNDQWAEGMGRSIAEGVRHAASSGAAAVLIALTDQPEIRTEHYRVLIDGYLDGEGIVATGYPQGPGAPALFPREFFGDLKELSADVGAREILRRHAGRLTIVPNPAAARDIDSPADL